MRELGRFRIDPGHPCLPGHFPGRPIVPGVVLLDEACATLPAVPRGLPSVKFLGPVLAGQEVVVLADAAGGTLTCAVDGRAVLRFSLVAAG